MQNITKHQTGTTKHLVLLPLPPLLYPGAIGDLVTPPSGDKGVRVVRMRHPSNVWKEGKKLPTHDHQSNGHWPCLPAVSTKITHCRQLFSRTEERIW